VAVEQGAGFFGDRVVGGVAFHQDGVEGGQPPLIAVGGTLEQARDGGGQGDGEAAAGDGLAGGHAHGANGAGDAGEGVDQQQSGLISLTKSLGDRGGQLGGAQPQEGGIVGAGQDDYAAAAGFGGQAGQEGAHFAAPLADEGDDHGVDPRLGGDLAQQSALAYAGAGFQAQPLAAADGAEGVEHADAQGQGGVDRAAGEGIGGRAVQGPGGFGQRGAAVQGAAQAVDDAADQGFAWRNAGLRFAAHDGGSRDEAAHGLEGQGGGFGDVKAHHFGEHAAHPHALAQPGLGQGEAQHVAPHGEQAAGGGDGGEELGEVHGGVIAQWAGGGKRARVDDVLIRPGASAMVRAMTPLLADLLATHAPPTRAPFVPELTLHFARDLIPIWEALDAYLGSPPSGSPAPFWAVPWVGGQVVARHLLDHPEVVRGKKVLDFGAGSGIGTVAAVRAGAAQVVATEIDPIAVEALQANLALNGLAGRPEVVVRLEDVVGTDEGWDVVLAGDMCYERGPAGRIFQWLQQLASTRQVLMADPDRGFLPGEGLAALARYEVPTHQDIDGQAARVTTLYRVLGV